MENDSIYYEFANEYLPKISLKLEYLLLNIERACFEDHPVIHYEAIKNTIKLLKIAEKPEIKSRFLKEYLRMSHGKISNDEDNIKKDLILEQIHNLNHIGGRFGDALHQNPFLQSIRLAQLSEPLEFSLLCPQLTYWLNAASSVRREDLKSWLEHFYVLFDTVALYLSLLRENAIFEDLSITGFYQFPIQKNNYQLIMLKIPRKICLIPKIQLGHHGLSLRMCDAKTYQDAERQSVVLQIAIGKL